MRIRLTSRDPRVSRSLSVAAGLTLLVGLTAPAPLEAQTVVNANAGYSYEMLDPTTDINRKQLRLLEKR